MIKNVELYAEKAQYGRLVRIWLTSRSRDMGMDAQVSAIKRHLEDMRTLVFKDHGA